MIFRQLFDHESCTYTYLIAHAASREAILVDSVINNVPQYLQLIKELDLNLVLAIDTHIHADHVTGMGPLRNETQCAIAIGEHAKAECINYKVREGEQLEVGDISMDVLYTPGHTDDSYSFVMKDRVLTGDTLLIRGTGRTDFQNGDPAAQYDSLFNKLLKMPDDTLVYPAHDYNGMTISTIGEEKRFNPRLQVGSEQEYVELMNGLEFDPPKLIDIAVPANLKCGLEPVGDESEN
jgi:glyoxylase-like metal-dependent hydrolase (beta-lactamase superfamily II)